MSSKFLLTVGTAIALCSTSAAVAAGIDAVASKRVSYEDLNLASPSGIKALSSRIRRAAAEVCDTRHSMVLREMQLERRCVRDALASAQVQVALAVARNERQLYARAKFIELASRR